MTESPSIAIRAALIIPALNEEAVIAEALGAIPAGIYERIIVAVNGSTDRTAEVASQLGASVVNIAERGYGAACLAAIGTLPDSIDAVVFMQADNSEDASQARLLLAPICAGQADLVIGSRVLGVAAPGSLLGHQRLGNRLATTLIQLFLGYRYTDLGPFRAISLAKLRQLEMQDRNYGWTVEMQVRAVQRGLRIVEIPVNSRVRTAGENKVSGNVVASFKAGWKIIWTIGRLLVSR
jgi:glycosyltransferase involved in cell wall biosynthesis